MMALHLRVRGKGGQGSDNFVQLLVQVSPDVKVIPAEDSSFSRPISTDEMEELAKKLASINETVHLSSIPLNRDSGFRLEHALFGLHHYNNKSSTSNNTSSTSNGVWRSTNSISSDTFNRCKSPTDFFHRPSHGSTEFDRFCRTPIDSYVLHIIHAVLPVRSTHLYPNSDI